MTLVVDNAYCNLDSNNKINNIQLVVVLHLKEKNSKYFIYRTKKQQPTIIIIFILLVYLSEYIYT